MKKILIVLLVTFHSALIFGATATIPNLTANPGSVVVPVNVAGFDSIVSINMYFEYDPAVVTYSTYSNPALSGMLVNAYTVGTSHRIGISWSASVAIGSNVSGTLVNIVFTYIAGSSNFTFLPTICLVKQRYSLVYITVPVAYTNGSIGPNSSAPVSIPQMLNQIPTNGLAIPLNVDFSNIIGGVNAFTFIIEYDATKLVYQNFANNILGVTVLPQTVPTTRLVIQWEYIGSPGSSLSGKLIDLVFNYIGGTSALQFNEDFCNIANNAGLTVPGVYSDGLITQAPESVVKVTVGTAIASPGTEVLIPVTVDNFTNIGAFDLHIDFTQSVLGYVELVDINPLIVPLVNLASNSTATEVGINWNADATALTIPSGGKLFDIKFSYTSGNTPLTFDQIQCAIGDFTSLNLLTVNYVDGNVSETPTNDATATIPDVLATLLSSFEIPINVTGYTNLGAFDLVIDYDGAVLDFIDLTNNQPDLATFGTFSFNNTGSKLLISWTINDLFATEGINVPDGKLFDMIFYNKGGNSDLVFDQTLCSTSKIDYSLINVAYTDGSVESGIGLQLKLYFEGLYNSATGTMNKAMDYVGSSYVYRFPGSVADHITVELRDVANFANLIHQIPDVNLNQDGTATAIIPAGFSGNYFITISHRNHIETTSLSKSFTGSTVIYDFTTSASQAFGNNQKQLAAGIFGFFTGDVNQDGFVDGGDMIPLDNDAALFVNGYITTDLDGNGTVGLEDMNMLNSNAQIFVSSIKP